MAGFRNHIWYKLLDEEGIPVSGGSIWLYNYKRPTEPLRIFDVNGDTATYPLTTDVNGAFDFYVRDYIYSASTGYTWNQQFIISWSKDDKSGLIRGDHLWGEFESITVTGGLARLNKAMSNNLGWMFNNHVDGKFGLIVGCGSSSSSSSSSSLSISSSSSSSSL
jgi:hypothetical protein